jgi:hypothetical protein
MDVKEWLYRRPVSAYPKVQVGIAHSNDRTRPGLAVCAHTARDGKRICFYPVLLTDASCGYRLRDLAYDGTEVDDVLMSLNHIVTHELTHVFLSSKFDRYMARVSLRTTS